MTTTVMSLYYVIISPNSKWLVTSRLDTTRYLAHGMHFGIRKSVATRRVVLVGEHGALEQTRLYMLDTLDTSYVSCHVET